MGGIVLLFSSTTIVAPQTLTAQNWTGATGTTTNLYRSGNIGIGFTGAPSCGSPLEINGDVNMAPAASALRINCTPVLRNLGANNLFVGDNAGNVNTGIQNTFLGYFTGLANTTGSENTFSGDRAGVVNTTGSSNCFTGATSGFSNTTGNSNIFSGFESGYSNTTGSENVYIGYQSGYNLTINNNNAFVGFGSGTALTTATNSALLGSNAGGNLAEIYESVLIGTDAGYDATGGNTTSSSVIIGYQAASSDGGGSANTVIGYRAANGMQPVSTENTLIGFDAGSGIQIASANVFLGSSSGTNVTTGYGNTLIGTATNSGATNQGNTVVGLTAGVATGFDNGTALGANAFVSLGNNSTAIGVNSVACAPNTIVLGSGLAGSNEVVVIGGCQANFAGVGQLEIINNGMWANGLFTASDKRLKTNIEPLDNSLSIILKLGGYSYNYKDESETGVALSKDRTVGVIAQELEEHFPFPLKEGANGYFGVDYNQLIPLLIEGIKEQQGKIEELEKLVATERDGDKTSSKAKPAGILAQNNPNPFSGSTEIEYEIYNDFEKAEVRIYDMSGNLEFSEILFENNATITINSQFLNPGIYAYTLLVDGYSVETKTMVVLK